MRRKSAFTFLLSLLVAGFLHGQDSLQKPRRHKLAALPVVFYSPDTRWGAGGAGVFNFLFPADSIRARRSSITFGAAFTQNRQVLFYLPYQLYVKNGLYWFYGEVGYYNYVYNFFGTGNGSSSDVPEKYTAHYPRLRLSASRQLKPGFYAGVRYAFDDFAISNRDTAGVLIKETLTGSSGGTISGCGLVFNYDTRDRIFYPGKGVLAELVWYAENQFTGSDFSYTRIAFDGSAYHTFGWKHILACNAYTLWNFGDVPFQQMAMIGGTKKMRGFFEGRYRDKCVSMLQVEYRADLFWRLGVVAFAGSGLVAPTPGAYNLSNLRHSAGAGLRVQLDKEQHTNVRLDYGFGGKPGGFYLTVGEAF